MFFSNYESAFLDLEAPRPRNNIDCGVTTHRVSESKKSLQRVYSNIQVQNNKRLKLNLKGSNTNSSLKRKRMRLRKCISKGVKIGSPVKVKLKQIKEKNFKREEVLLSLL
mmetsp:Transcript_27823/g.24617  ORF Transcript_27823/g.24617 Transcript_27823/m.24617 type:complete len:110 (+) Transcript_27823:1418-1747(+)